MDFVLDDKYLLESLVALIRDEGNRIVASGLATAEEMNRAAEPILKSAVDNVGNGKAVLKVLSTFHHDLSCIKLPGDFEHIRVEAEPIVEEEPVVEPEPEKPEVSDESVVISVLETMAYELGKTGNHDAAYVIERAMRDIELLKTAEGEYDHLQLRTHERKYMEDEETEDRGEHTEPGFYGRESEDVDPQDPEYLAELTDRYKTTEQQPEGWPESSGGEPFTGLTGQERHQLSKAQEEMDKLFNLSNEYREMVDGGASESELYEWLESVADIDDWPFIMKEYKYE